VAWELLQHPARPRYDLSSLELVGYGGAPAASELVRGIGEAWPHAQPAFGWGMTETCATFTHHVGEDYAHRPDSCGPTTPVGELKVVDAEGNALPPGEVGELMAYGPHVVRRYWNKPEAARTSIRPRWRTSSTPTPR
jgi:long-chain acyl-CoA synthetase